MPLISLGFSNTILYFCMAIVIPFKKEMLTKQVLQIRKLMNLEEQTLLKVWNPGSWGTVNFMYPETRLSCAQSILTWTVAQDLRSLYSPEYVLFAIRPGVVESHNFICRWSSIWVLMRVYHLIKLGQLWILFSWDRISHCNPDWSWTYSHTVTRMAS